MKNTIEETINLNNFIIHNVKGISMLPLLVEDEDLVKIEKLSETPKELDMVLFSRNKNDNKYILHRILKKEKDYYLICGDNQNEYEKVYPNQIIGKVTGYYKNGRYVSINDQEYLDYLKSLQLDINKRNHLKSISAEMKNLVLLIRKAMSNIEINQENFDFEKIYALSQKYNMSPFIYKTIDSNYCPKTVYEKFTNAYNLNIQRTLLFDNERQKIFSKFNENKIKHVPLKGIIINKLYPEYGTRVFTDNDILYKENDNIIDIMKELNYGLTYKTKAELIFTKKPIFSFEMHHRLFHGNYSYTKYFEKAMDRVTPFNEYECHMTNEDFYAYFLAHMNKHYSGSGAGIRFYLDLYYIREKIKFDKNKLDNILKEINLLDFNNKVIDIMEKVLLSDNFPVKEMNEVFVGANFGVKEHAINNGIKKHGKFKYIIKRVFPSLSSMSNSYLFLNKYPFLLPAVWIYRIVDPKRWKHIKYEAKYLLKNK